MKSRDRHIAKSDTGSLGSRRSCGGFRGCWAAAAVGVVLLAGGCASGVHTPANLPAQYVAPPLENMANIQLSRLSNAAVSAETIDRGDVLEVTLATDSSELAPTTGLVRVDDNGNANVPLIGPVPVAGLEPARAECAIAAASVERSVFRNPHVTVTVRNQRKNHVTVIGAVKNPGVFELPRGSSSLLAALVAAGGLSADAAPSVDIRQPSAVTAMANPATPGDNVKLASYHDAPVSTASTRLNLLQPEVQPGAGSYLNDGSVVVVGKRDPRRIHVIGLVNKPGQYEIPPDQDLFLLDALALAGGRTMEFADKVLIIRQATDGSPVRVEVSVDRAKSNVADNLRLASGDVISVEQTAVTGLVDTVRTFFRVGFSSALPMF